MKAITIHQPWASLIAIGAKHFETRSWHTEYRGNIAIHVGEKEMFPGNPALSAIVNTLAAAIPKDDNGNIPLPHGAIIAVAELVECYPTDGLESVYTKQYLKFQPNELIFGDHTPGRYAWELANVRALPEPIPCRGRQGLWEWDERGLGI
jgi:hypothetical protein